MHQAPAMGDRVGEPSMAWLHSLSSRSLILRAQVPNYKVSTRNHPYDS